jgi:hypothetical protein
MREPVSRDVARNGGSKDVLSSFDFVTRSVNCYEKLIGFERGHTGP